MSWRIIRAVDAVAGIALIRLLAPLARRRPRRSASAIPKRILLIKFWGIGNFFMLLPTIRSLRQAYPHATIDFLTLESNREAVTMTAATDAVFCLDTATPLRFLATLRQTLGRLRQNRYHVVIDFEQFARISALVAHLIGAGQSIGFSTEKQERHYLYTDPVPYDNTLHIARSFHALARRAGTAAEFDAEVQLDGLQDLKCQGKALLRAHGGRSDEPLALLHLGTSKNFGERRWPPERFAELADLLAERYGMRIVLTGLGEESHLVEATRREMRQAAALIEPGGNLPFREYCALIAAADLVVSADTAAVHIASALNVPVAGLYGPNTPPLYGPWGHHGIALYAAFDCSPCITNFNAKINTCHHPDGKGACMHAISAQTVFRALEELFLEPQAPSRLACFRHAEPAEAETRSR